MTTEITNAHKEIPGNPSTAKSSRVLLNDRSNGKPLRLLSEEDWRFWIYNGYVIIKNAVNPKTYAVPTSGIGLNNLDNRYKLITKRNIIIENNFKTFSVKLPILKF